MEQELKKGLRGQVLHSIISGIGCWKVFAGKCVIARLDPTSPDATLPAATIVRIWRKFNLTKNEYLAIVVLSVCKSQTMGDSWDGKPRTSVCERMSSAARQPRPPDRSGETWSSGAGAPSLPQKSRQSHWLLHVGVVLRNG